MTDRAHYLRHVIGPLVDELRASYPLTLNPDVRARMTEAINVYELEIALLESDAGRDAAEQAGAPVSAPLG